eukprot:6191371-Pyramimonas_sp.AAC.1
MKTILEALVKPLYHWKIRLSSDFFIDDCCLRLKLEVLPPQVGVMEQNKHFWETGLAKMPKTEGPTLALRSVRHEEVQNTSPRVALGRAGVGGPAS